MVNIHGYIDRVDKKENDIRIVDYKTGNGKFGYRDKKVFSSIPDLFDKEKENRPKEIFQVLMYSLLYQKQTDGNNIIPSIIFLRNIFDENNSFNIQYKSDQKDLIFNSYKDLEIEFEKSFQFCLEEIFNPNIDFHQCTNDKTCQYCPFKEICKK